MGHGPMGQNPTPPVGPSNPTPPVHHTTTGVSGTVGGLPPRPSPTPRSGVVGNGLAPQPTPVEDDPDDDVDVPPFMRR
nr:hypothetical protein GCM10020241_17920 [Streptoalloteichus tenebrarius]